jgi:hypothetical protein
MNNENNSLSTLKTGNIEKLQYICSVARPLPCQQKNKLRKKEERQKRK